MKTRQLFAILAATTALMVSCQKAEVGPGKAVLPDGAIGFSAYTGVTVTKGEVIKAADVQKEGIGVFAFYQKAVAEEPVPFNSRKFISPDYMYNQQVTYDESAGWTYEPLKYWPNNVGDRLSFFAYAPYDAKQRWDDLGITTSSNADRLSVTFEINEEVSAQKDLLWAVPRINQTNKLDGEINNPAKTIKFEFKHVTSKVGIMVGVTTGHEAEEWYDDNTIIVLKCIKFKGLNSQFKYTYPITDWQVDEDGLKVDFCEGKTFELGVKPDAEVDTITTTNWKITPRGVLNTEKYAPYLPEDQYMFLAPQTFTDQTVSITYVVKTTDPLNKKNSSSVTNTITKNLSDVLAKADGKFEAGKAYNLKFLIGLDDVNIAADIIDWDDDIYEKEIYTPENYAVKMYQGDFVYAGLDEIKAATFRTNDPIYINVRDIDLSDSNSGIYHLLDYAADSIPYKDLTEAMVAMADTPDSDLRLRKINGAIGDYVDTKTITFDNMSAKVLNEKLSSDSVYVFKYTESAAGAVRYAIFKTGDIDTVKVAPDLTIASDKTEVDAGDSLVVTITEGGEAVTGLRRSSFKILDSLLVNANDAFDVKAKAGEDGKYVFTSKLTDTTGLRIICFCGGDSLKVRIKNHPYKFWNDTITIRRGATVTDSLKVDTTKIATTVNDGIRLAFGNRGIKVINVNNGAVTLSASDTITRAAVDTLKYIKQGVTLATAVVKVATFSVSSSKKVFFSNGNLYYDGSEFKFENSQYSYETSYSEDHVSHFRWANTSQSLSDDIAIATSNVETARPDSAKGITDVFFTNATSDTPRAGFTVNGKTGVWRTLSGGHSGEWKYLLKQREVVRGKVGNKNSYITITINVPTTGSGITHVKGLLIYPDDFTMQIPDDASILTTGLKLVEWDYFDSRGCVFLPYAGQRDGTIFYRASEGFYWSSSAYDTPAAGEEKDEAYNVHIDNSEENACAADKRLMGNAVRLVTDVK